MIVEIALGIVLAVIILYFLPLILVAGVAMAGLIIAAIALGLIIYFVFSLNISSEDVEVIFLVVLFLLLPPIVVGIIVTRIPWVRIRLGEPEPLGLNGRLLGEYLFAIFRAYWLIGAVAGGLTLLVSGIILAINCELRILPFGMC